MNMLNLTLVRTLTLATPTQSGRPAYLSAASGLVHVGNKLYVVADDENYLGIFSDTSNEPGVLKQLFSQELPLEQIERKAKKRDLEVLTFVPPYSEYHHGALMALGSGSKKRRDKGAIISFDSHGMLHDKVNHLDLSFVYKQLRDHVAELNIEGAIIVDDDIVLLQRGHVGSPNAVIRCNADAFFSVINGSDKKLQLSIQQYDLGAIEGIPLCFTDATTLPDGTVIFAAAAEDTSDSYLDGQCKGSAIGVLTPEGELGNITLVDKVIKAEGIAARVIDGKVHLIMVTDADDSAIAAQVYSAKVNSMP
jgi:hypothetical protein